MGAATGIIAGIAVAAGAVALMRFAEQRARALKAAVTRSRDKSGRVIDFERDPATGVFRPK